jgi:hypothetical protein
MKQWEECEPMKLRDYTPICIKIGDQTVYEGPIGQKKTLSKETFDQVMDMDVQATRDYFGMRVIQLRRIDD